MLGSLVVAGGGRTPTSYAADNDAGDTGGISCFAPRAARRAPDRRTGYRLLLMLLALWYNAGAWRYEIVDRLVVTAAGAALLALVLERLPAREVAAGHAAPALTRRDVLLLGLILLGSLGVQVWFVAAPIRSATWSSRHGAWGCCSETVGTARTSSAATICRYGCSSCGFPGSSSPGWEVRLRLHCRRSRCWRSSCRAACRSGDARYLFSWSRRWRAHPGGGYGGAICAGAAGVDERGLVGPGRRDAGAAAADCRLRARGRALELGLLGDRAGDQAAGDHFCAGALIGHCAAMAAGLLRGGACAASGGRLCAAGWRARGRGCCKPTRLNRPLPVADQPRLQPVVSAGRLGRRRRHRTGHRAGSFRMLGFALLGITALLLCRPLLWRADRPQLAETATGLALAFFCLPTQIHERYLFLTLGFLILMVACVPRAIWAFGLLATSATLNILGTLQGFAPPLQPLIAQSPLPALLAAINLAVLLWLLVRSLRVRPGNLNSNK